MIIGSQSGHYSVALLDKAHSVLPPEIHQAIDPYLNRIEEKLNPNFQPHGSQDARQMWPSGATQSSAPAGWPVSSGAAPAQPSQQQPAWPAASQSQPAWPTQPQQQPQASNDPYGVQSQEPRAYPGPYSAEVPTSRDY